jgi:hypothetical protein
MDWLAHWFILMLATSTGRQTGRRFFFGIVLCLAANVCILGVLLAAIFSRSLFRRDRLPFDAGFLRL